MPDYRAYIVGSDGHFYKSVALDALDDASAIEATKQLVDGHDVELWQLDRKIGKFEQEKQSTLNIWAAPSCKKFILIKPCEPSAPQTIIAARNDSSNANVLGNHARSSTAGENLNSGLSVHPAVPRRTTLDADAAKDWSKARHAIPAPKSLMACIIQHRK